MTTTAPRTNTRTEWASVLSAGIPTFLGAPLVEPSREALRAAGARAAYLGMPFDSTTIARSGAMIGPRAVRDVSSYQLTYHLEYDVDLMEAWNIVDCGDVPVLPANAQVTMDRCRDRVAEILAADALPVVVGGDHSITIGCTWGVDKGRPGRYGYIMFDTHLDTAMDVGGERLNHCCPVPRTMELDSFDPHNAVIIGPHGAMNPRHEYEYCRDNGIVFYTPRQVAQLGYERVAREAVQRASDGTQGVYLSVDLDSLDVAYSPGTCVPTAGGLTNRELLWMLDIIGREADLVSMDTVEIAPQYDSGQSSYTACQVIVDVLAAQAVRRGSRQP